MPVNTIKRSAAAAAARIRRNWTREERLRREVLAADKQLQLLRAIGLAPALAPVKR